MAAKLSTPGCKPRSLVCFRPRERQLLPWAAPARLRALVEVVRSSSYRKLLAELPRYDSVKIGYAERVRRG